MPALEGPSFFDLAAADRYWESLQADTDDVAADIADLAADGGAGGVPSQAEGRPRPQRSARGSLGGKLDAKAELSAAQRRNPRGKAIDSAVSEKRNAVESGEYVGPASDAEWWWDDDWYARHGNTHPDAADDVQSEPGCDEVVTSHRRVILTCEVPRSRDGRRSRGGDRGGHGGRSTSAAHWAGCDDPRDSAVAVAGASANGASRGSRRNGRQSHGGTGGGAPDDADAGDWSWKSGWEDADGGGRAGDAACSGWTSWRTISDAANGADSWWQSASADRDADADGCWWQSASTDRAADGSGGDAWWRRSGDKGWNADEADAKDARWASNATEFSWWAAGEWTGSARAWGDGGDESQSSTIVGGNGACAAKDSWSSWSAGRRWSDAADTAEDGTKAPTTAGKERTHSWKSGWRNDARRVVSASWQSDDWC